MLHVWGIKRWEREGGEREVTNTTIVFAPRVSCWCYSLFLSFYEHDHLVYFFVIRDLIFLNLDMLHKDSHQILFLVSIKFYF